MSICEWALKRNGRMETELYWPAEELGEEVVLGRGCRGNSGGV